jgi:hypothetical protein
MKEKVRFLGLDVHAETIAVAVAESTGEVRSLGTIRAAAHFARAIKGTLIRIYADGEGFDLRRTDSALVGRRDYRPTALCLERMRR